jgi:hypothetical protein
MVTVLSRALARLYQPERRLTDPTTLPDGSYAIGCNDRPGFDGT